MSRLAPPISLHAILPRMDAQPIISAVQQEIRKHVWDTFVDQPPVVRLGGHGVVVPGCSACRKRINTMDQFLDHISNDVLPGVIENAVLASNREPGDEA
jgi:hypothetical protein